MTALLPFGALEVLLRLSVLLFATLLEIVVAFRRHGFSAVEGKARGRERGPLKLSAAIRYEAFKGALRGTRPANVHVTPSEHRSFGWSKSVVALSKPLPNGTPHLRSADGESECDRRDFGECDKRSAKPPASGRDPWEALPIISSRCI